MQADRRQQLCFTGLQQLLVHPGLRVIVCTSNDFGWLVGWLIIRARVLHFGSQTAATVPDSLTFFRLLNLRAPIAAGSNSQLGLIQQISRWRKYPRLWFH